MAAFTTLWHHAFGPKVLQRRWWWQALGVAYVVFGLTETASAASEPKKLALLIGNGRYVTVQKLNNAENDVRLLATSLRDIGFTAVEAFNLTLPEMVRRVDAFAESIGPSDVGLFYYAGHAVQLDGKNYLVPITAEVASEIDLPLKTFNINLLLDRIGKAPDSVNIIVLDACRNNPYTVRTRSLKPGTPTPADGLARIETPAGKRGMYIAYSTSPGQVAYDGQGKNSPYATALAREIKRPGLNITEVFQNVRNSVMQVTATQVTGPQIPWESSSLTANLVLTSSANNAALRRATTHLPGSPSLHLEITPLTRGPRATTAEVPRAPNAPLAPPPHGPAGLRPAHMQ